MLEQRKSSVVCPLTDESLDASKEPRDCLRADMRQRHFLEAWGDNTVRYSNEELEGVLPIFDVWYEFMVRFVNIAKEYGLSVSIEIVVLKEDPHRNSVSIYFLLPDAARENSCIPEGKVLESFFYPDVFQGTSHRFETFFDAGHLDLEDRVNQIFKKIDNYVKAFNQKAS